jgi:hypothetical protein
LFIITLAQWPQEIQAAFGVRGREAGEQLIADVRADCGFALVPCRGIVTVQVVDGRSTTAWLSWRQEAVSPQSELSLLD